MVIYVSTAIVGVPVAVGCFLLMLSMVDFGGANNPGPLPFLLIAFVGAAAVAAMMTAFFHRYAHNETDGRVHSGPVAVGIAAGVFVGVVLLNAALPYTFWTNFVIIPLAGGVIGSFIDVPLEWPGAGAIVGVFAVVTALLTLDF